MKKLLLIVGLAALAFTGQAQNHVRQSFLNDKIFSITFSNLLSGLTNTQVPLNPGTYPGTNNLGFLVDGQYNGATNQPQNVIYTVGTKGGPDTPDIAGPAVAVSATNSYWTNANIFKDVRLWVDRDGRQAPIYYNTTTNLGNDSGLRVSPSFHTVVITVSSTNTTAFTASLRFAPVWDGINVDTNSSYIWPVAFTYTPNAANMVKVVATNFPTYNYPGCKALRLLDVTSTATTANSVGVLRGVDLVGWIP